MLLRTRAPTPSDCSTLKTVFSTLLTFIILEKVLVTTKTCNYSLIFINHWKNDDKKIDMTKWFVYATNQFPVHKLNMLKTTSKTLSYLMTSLWDREELIFNPLWGNSHLNLCSNSFPKFCGWRANTKNMSGFGRSQTEICSSDKQD